MRQFVKTIRTIFSLFGKNYEKDFSQIVAQSDADRLHEAPKYLKPVNIGDEILRWWIKQANKLD